MAEGAVPITVVAHGMVSCLGRDAASCCAAARAGLDRAERIPEMPTGTPTSAYEAVAGHAVPFVGGFEGDARLSRLLSAAAEDLVRHPGAAVDAKEKLGVYLSLPDPLRHLTGEALLADEAERSARAEERREAAETPDPDRPRRFWEAAMRWLDHPLARAPWRAARTTGHTGFAEALLHARTDLDESRIDCALVAGVDSYLDLHTMVWLAQTARLKSAELAAGLRPGESAVLVLVRRAADRSRETRPLLSRISIQAEPAPFLSGGLPQGRGLSGALLAAGPELGWDRGEAIWLLTDQNGESWRAADWGHAAVRLRAEWPESADPLLSFPAAAHGETGAASGGVALCTALAAWERGYAPSPFAGVLSAGDDASRTLLVVRRSEA